MITIINVKENTRVVIDEKPIPDEIVIKIGNYMKNATLENAA